MSVFKEVKNIYYQTIYDKIKNNNNYQGLDEWGADNKSTEFDVGNFLKKINDGYTSVSNNKNYRYYNNWNNIIGDCIFNSYCCV